MMTWDEIAFLIEEALTVDAAYTIDQDVDRVYIAIYANINGTNHTLDAFFIADTLYDNEEVNVPQLVFDRAALANENYHELSRN